MTDTAAGEGLDFRFDIARSRLDVRRAPAGAPGRRARSAGRHEGAPAARLLRRGRADERSRHARAAGRRGRRGRGRQCARCWPATGSPPRCARTSRPLPGSGSAPCRHSWSTARSGVVRGPSAGGAAPTAARGMGAPRAGVDRRRRREPATSTATAESSVRLPFRSPRPPGSCSLADDGAGPAAGFPRHWTATHERSQMTATNERTGPSSHLTSCPRARPPPPPPRGRRDPGRGEATGPRAVRGRAGALPSSAAELLGVPAQADAAVALALHVQRDR